VGLRLSVLVLTGPESDVAFCKMDAKSFQGVKQLEFGADLPPHSRDGVAKGLRL